MNSQPLRPLTPPQANQTQNNERVVPFLTGTILGSLVTPNYFYRPFPFYYPFYNPFFFPRFPRFRRHHW